MSSFISRLLKSPIATKRLVSQLTQSGEGKFSEMLRQFSLKRILGVFERKGGVGERTKSTTSVSSELTDDMELATGIFKRELMLRQGGCTDPWAMKRPLKRGAGLEKDPTVIPSAFDGRLVGCLCLGDRVPKWMWLEKGEPKRCECGHYFVLKNVPAV
ncbi:cytochrome c oxidase subunit 5B, mitochondrial [Drosophila grimshawi]|uniref:GH13842 n=1 Tax=Drosophila grimshawi TaxID=7222 RepID=B4JR98_DROGR|nr:cytochrome c oxidase subunit 5B, mitochondrial [Drosophila grimshawi]EDV99428.1 GH13842 [Drosophila grimshawi]